MANRIYNKYRNTKIISNGIKYDSKKESRRGNELKLLEKSGIIKDLKMQVKFELQPSYKFKGKTIRSINYIADFTYIQNGELIVEDVKGIQTDSFKIKKKIFEYKYGIEINII